ncbi:MAG TPA: hypothetical protein VGP68_21975, partial [Gemmataceae bacterium]|nr:hypothetical protein [Gemmataceae bacterium]
PVPDAKPTSRKLFRYTPAFLLLGLALRAYHYGRNPSVWHDEAALILNVIGKSFVGLLGPLFFAEDGPPLFLWLERAIRLLLGDSVFSLRLLPFAASCAALVMLAITARRRLLPAAAPIAVLLFACSRSLLWHASEAKPYAIDVALAALLPMLACGPLRNWSLEHRLIFFALLAPVVVMLSFPGCFLIGGVVLSLLPEVCLSRRQLPWLAFLFLLVSSSGAFLALLLGPIHAQRCESLESCWLRAFAPWDQPWRLPVWTAVSLFGVPRYCLDPLADLLLLPAIIGYVSLWTRDQRSLVILLISPVALAFAAACVHAYPFDASRVIAFATPALALGVAEGSVISARWLSRANKSAERRLARWTPRIVLAILMALLLLPLGRALSDIVSPWPRADVASAARFVMQERLNSDPVVGNQWEHAYYFRSLHEAFHFWDGAPIPDAPRFWLVVTAGTDAECDLLAAVAMSDRWHPIRSRNFEQCHALLMVRNETLALQSK